MLDIRLQPLNARPRDSADLVAVECSELVSIQCLEEPLRQTVGEEVDERVPDVALVPKIDREVEEIEALLVEAELVDDGQKHSLRVLIRDVSQHDRRNAWSCPPANVAGRCRRGAGTMPAQCQQTACLTTEKWLLCITQITVPSNSI